MTRSLKKKSKQHPLVGLGFQGIVRFLSWFPLSVNHRIGTVLGFLLWWIPNPLKHISARNIDIACPQLSRAERACLVRSSLQQLGKGFCELGPLWCWRKDKLLPLVTDSNAAADVRKALRRGRGVLLLSPHLGAWEMTGWYWSALLPTTCLYRPPRVRSMGEFMRKARERDGARLVPTDLNGIKALFKALKSNEVVGILPDQDPGKSSGVIVPFFFHPANTITLASKLIRKTGCAVYFTFAERLPQGAGYNIHLIEGSDDLAAVDEEVAAAALNRGIEECVRRIPEQYLWSYDRYKKVRRRLAREANVQMN